MDDYIVKPFEPEILLARVRAALRRLLARGTGRLAAEGTTAWVFERFDKEIRRFYEPEELDRGYLDSVDRRGEHVDTRWSPFRSAWRRPPPPPPLSATRDSADHCYETTTFPFMSGWMEQWYLNVPAFGNLWL